MLTATIRELLSYRMELANRAAATRHLRGNATSITDPPTHQVTLASFFCGS
jgi:hypothetical protein